MARLVSKATSKVSSKAAKKTTRVKKTHSKIVLKAKKLSASAIADLVLRRPSQGPSTKTLHAGLDQLRPHLGRPCPHFGKRGVVQLASVAPTTKKGAKQEALGPPRFNKYAGWVEWQNAIFLWVNAAGGNFTNTFTNGGKQVTWYVGGANPTEKSPIVGRLLSISKNVDRAKTQVLLFCRERGTEPYVYCGSLGYVAHDATKKGFEFTWRLKEHARLSKTDGFQTLLDAAANDASCGAKKSVRRTVARWA